MVINVTTEIIYDKGVEIDKTKARENEDDENQNEEANSEVSDQSSDQDFEQKKGRRIFLMI